MFLNPGWCGNFFSAGYGKKAPLDFRACGFGLAFVDQATRLIALQLPELIDIDRGVIGLTAVDAVIGPQQGPAHPDQCDPG